MFPSMLQQLRIRNLAIVEDVSVSFGSGLNVLTGETGAGKSIIIGALGLVLGERADKGLIRSGEDSCSVEASFELADPEGVDAILDELGLEACEDGVLIVRRTVSGSGSGKVFVNDSPATVQVLKRLGDLLVDMHGPHDHQSLLSCEFQLDLLDAFGHTWKTRGRYEEAYRLMLDARRQKDALDMDEDAAARELDLLSFQCKEIEAAELDDTDEEALEQEHTTVANAGRILELAEGIQTALTEGDSSAFDGLAFAQKALAEMTGLLTDASAWQEEAESIAVQIQELASGVSSRAQTIEGDPGRLQWLEDRMALLHRLKRKYGGTVEDIQAFYRASRQRLDALQSRESQLEELDAALRAALQGVREAGEALRKERTVAAGKLADAITRELRDLGFAHAAFEVALDQAEPGPSGIDAIEFGFAPNMGENMRPLRAIASSGEISRVMLAIKAILAAHDRIPVLVFDEIDANVGGETATAVGEKLHAVAANHQILCITHLPQVAVQGQRHFVVGKQVSEGRTRTCVEPVEGDRRTEEVARMLGGRDLTTVTLKHAGEMLKKRAAR
jgi:DNA repair protein RecN (Recombination protein N)